MKILFLVSHLKSGGAERTVAYLSKYLANQDELDVSILSISDEIFYTVDPNVKLVTLGLQSGSSNPVQKVLRAIKRKQLIYKYLKDYRPDVVFCMMASATKYIMRAIKKKRRFTLITSERINPAAVTDPKLLQLKNQIFSLSDGIVFQTIRAKEFYSPEIQEKGTVIYNAVGNELVYQVPETVKRVNKISAIGRLSDQKDYPTLFRAFQTVLKSHPDFILEIFGDGPLEATLKALAEEMGISEQIVFKGACKDAILQAANSACYVMSSLFEGMPNALMEAMAVGLPCVSTDCPNGPAELITDGENGLLTEVANADQLAEAMLRMIDDRTFAEACGKKARNILQTNSVDVIAKQYMDFIVKTAQEKKRS